MALEENLKAADCDQPLRSMNIKREGRILEIYRFICEFSKQRNTGLAILLLKLQSVSSWMSFLCETCNCSNSSVAVFE